MERNRRNGNLRLQMKKTKKLSERLIETEERLDVSPDTLAFVMGIKYEMYRRYHNKEWDDTYSKRKDRFNEQLDNIDIEIERAILRLRKALRNLQSKSVKKTVTVRHSKERNLNGKG